MTVILCYLWWLHSQKLDRYLDSIHWIWISKIYILVKLELSVSKKDYNYKKTRDYCITNKICLNFVWVMFIFYLMQIKYIEDCFIKDWLLIQSELWELASFWMFGLQKLVPNDDGNNCVFLLLNFSVFVFISEAWKKYWFELLNRGPLQTIFSKLFVIW